MLETMPSVDVDVRYCRPQKRSRFVVAKVENTINALPDECLFEILRRLPGSRDRSVSACVSKRWLGLLSSIRPSEIQESEIPKLPLKPLPDLNAAADVDEENIGCLTRYLGGKEVTDVRLAAVAVGTAGRGGLGKLVISGAHPSRGVTDAGLAAIARGCPSLRVLSIRKLNSVTDQALAEVACSCPLLERLEISRCPWITDAGLVSVAAKCANLSFLSVDSCAGVGNEGVQAIGKMCTKLSSVVIKDCARVGDQGIASLMCAGTDRIEKINLHGLNISDVALACIGHYGKAVTDLSLTALDNVAERGFWVMGNALGLQKLRCLAITSCRGVTDMGLEAVAKGCPSLKQLRVSNCLNLSDVGLKLFAEKAVAAEALNFEECSRITLVGVLCALIICSERLKTLSLVKCSGIRDITCFPQNLPVCKALRNLTIRDCPGFTSASLALVGKICPNLVQLDLSGLVGVTDEGLLPLVESTSAGLVKVSLNGCVNLTDVAVSKLVKLNGSTLKEINLDGCNKLTDDLCLTIADSCRKLVELDMSTSAITDYGIALLASARHLDLQILSLKGCLFLTTNSLPLIGNMGSSLVGLNLKNCNGISPSGITSLEEKMYWCDILS